MGFQLSINHLADKTDTELRVLRGKRRSTGYNGGSPFPYITEQLATILPEQFDWRLFGAVTPVKGNDCNDNDYNDNDYNFYWYSLEYLIQIELTIVDLIK